MGGYRFAVAAVSYPGIAYALKRAASATTSRDEPRTAELLTLQAEIDRVFAGKITGTSFAESRVLGTYLLAGFVKILPKAGPLKLLAVKGPDRANRRGVHSLGAGFPRRR